VVLHVEDVAGRGTSLARLFFCVSQVCPPQDEGHWDGGNACGVTLDAEKWVGTSSMKLVYRCSLSDHGRWYVPHTIVKSEALSHQVINYSSKRKGPSHRINHHVSKKE
jgi:hypothetical protein